MRPQSMGAIIATLENAGYVASAPDPSDGRQALLSVTACWRDWLQGARNTRRDWLLRAVQAELSTAEQEQLAAAIPLLRRLIQF